MQKYLVIALILITATAAFAQDRMGISAVGNAELNYINIAPGAPFEMYLCLFDASVASIGGYECSVNFSNTTGMFVLAVSGPNGWTNFGTANNHLVGYQTPLPTQAVTVLCSYSMLYSGGTPFESLVLMGASEPSSFDGEGPGYSDGSNPDNLVMCSVPADGVVGTISTEVVANEAHSLTAVKALFN